MPSSDQTENNSQVLEDVKELQAVVVVPGTEPEIAAPVETVEEEDKDILYQSELEGDTEEIKSLDQWQLPLSIIQRIVKDNLPEGCNISKDAKSAFARIATVFINYLSINAYDASMSKNRKTLNQQSVEQALRATGLEFLIPEWQSRMTQWHAEMANRKAKAV